MKKILLVIVAIFVIAGAFLAFNFSATANTSYNKNSQQAQDSGTKFQDTPYFNYAYLISSDTLSPEAQRALDGFQLNKQVLSDGSTKIDLVALQGNYISQSYTLKPGQKLYFIEASWGEDSSGYDGSFSDDGAMIVDSNGYVI